MKHGEGFGSCWDRNDETPHKPNTNMSFSMMKPHPRSMLIFSNAANHEVNVDDETIGRDSEHAGEPHQGLEIDGTEIQTQFLSDGIRAPTYM
jgi:CRISPR/Cas system-associated protein Cas7 (RAMP superfamily)